jgi:ABC-2 type transport system ATP-binding protein
VIEIKDIYFEYGKGKLLFKGLSLSLKEGHIYGLLGKNGAGKSTLLKNIAGLVFPKSGKCLFRGVDVARRPVAVLEELYFLAEDFFVPALTPTQFMKSTAGFYPRFNKQEFRQYLELLNVDAELLMDKQSFGQQKKAMIAFGLATNTSLLIMDEPTNGLDIPSKIQFRKLIASVLTEDRCIIISTHQVRDLDSLIDTLLILEQQEILVNHALDEIVEKVSFGVFADTKGLPVLYEERGGRGSAAILKNDSGAFTKVDLELLFNAVISGNSEVINLLS